MGPPEQKLPDSAAAADLTALAEGIRARQVARVAEALNLIEDRRPASAAKAEALLSLLRTPGDGSGNQAARLGLTGPPGVGKSTLASALATALRGRGSTVAVLAVDPSSPRSGGALLGDRARIVRAGDDDGLFVRSLASGGELGGLARA